VGDRCPGFLVGSTCFRFFLVVAIVIPQSILFDFARLKQVDASDELDQQ
jgi:hypothetical protein